MTRSRLRLADGPRLEGVRVLVVDDAPHVREIVAEILTQGAKVIVAGCAEEALAAVQAERPAALACCVRGSSCTWRSRSRWRRLSVRWRA
jgi:PleD family two-component response regulator